MADRQRAYALKNDETELPATTPGGNFLLPVDSQHKARKMKILSLSRPHMRAFHLSWFSFFVCFTSTFAAAPLIPIIRDDLDLRKQDIGNANIASVSGSIFSRLAMGVLCDIVGPRYATAFLIMLVAPAIFSMATVETVTGYILVRFFISCSLATFVSCQFWMSSMFNSQIVGLANGVSAGWGNIGGGATQLMMPLLYNVFSNALGKNGFLAWRVSFYVPALLHVLAGLAVLVFGQDLPDGNYAALQSSGHRVDDKLWRVVFVGLRNYRGWILALTYGYCFGIELTVDNVIAEYFFDKFNLDLHTAGTIAASFGLANIFSRPCGGILSDTIARRFGMRGRLWSLWIVQTLGGVLCVILGMSHSLTEAIVVMLIFSVFVQAACGLTFGIVPFVSIRALGVVSGLTAGGGNIGAVITQAFFFNNPEHTYETGIQWMGYMILAATLPLALIYFPQWGGMFFPPSQKEYHTEENYYASEWSEAEKLEGNHANSLKFARNCRSERGRQKPMVYAATPLQGGCPVPA